MKSHQKNIAILGAGLVGRLLAFELSKINSSIHVYDKSPLQTPQSAAFIAAAMLAPLAESVSTEASIVKKGYYSLSRWPEIIHELNDEVFFQQLGSLIVWHYQDLSSATHFRNQLNFVTNSISETPKPEMLNKLRLKEIEPELSHQFESGIYLPEEGQLDNRELLSALLNQCINNGVKFFWDQDIDINQFPIDKYDQVIDCRGIGSKKDVSSLRGVRGEVVRVFAPEVTLSRPIRLIHPKYPIYIAPKRNHVYVIGATEIESEDDSPMSVRSSLELLSAAYTLHSGFAEARILEMSTQCRPSFKNNLPKIIQFNSKIIHVNGLYRHGFLIAPAIVDSVMKFIEQKDDSLIKQFEIDYQEAKYENIC